MYRHSEIILQMIYRNNEEVWISKIDCMVLVISSVAKQMVEYIMAYFLAGIKRMFLWYVYNTVAL